MKIDNNFTCITEAAGQRAITLVELIISIILLGMVIVGIFGIDLFSRQQFLDANKSATLQNEAIYVLSHISKQLTRAIGDVSGVSITSDFINATIDTNPDGIKNTDDDDISYNYIKDAFTISFRPKITDPFETLAKHVQFFTATRTGNCLTVDITTRWNPSQPSSLNNPEFNMTTSILMPSVSGI